MAQIAQLQKHSIIPDVLSDEITLSKDLAVHWPDAVLDAPGKTLDREATQPEPTLHLSPVSNQRHDDYVLIMTDPDLMSNNDANFGQVRHWLATNITVDSDGRIVIPEDGTISPYIGPAPLPNYISPRPHRYVFILSRPITGGSTKVDNNDLQTLQKEYSLALEGPQELQDLKDRWGFNAKKFLEMKGLKPEAVTYMLVGGTLKSAVDNITMTAQAGGNKISGK